MKNRKSSLELIEKDNTNAFLREVKYISGNKPIIIKDNIAESNSIVSSGSKMLEKFVPRYNSTVVNLLRKSDFDIIGIANMDEFAMGSTNKTSFFGNVTHPSKSEYTPGGSSGGSAALVASGVVDYALGTDTGGSVRQPAAFCGIYGMKPTYGLVSRYGVYSFASSFDTVGVLSSSVIKNAEVLSSIAMTDCKDQTSFCPDNYDCLSTINNPIKGMKIGVMTDWLNDGVAPYIKEEIENQINKLKQLGAIITEVHVDNTEKSFELYLILAYSEASSNLNRYDGIKFGNDPKIDADDVYKRSREAFGFEVRKRLLMGTYITSSSNSKKYYTHSQKIRNKMECDFSEVFKNVDCIVGPTTPNTTYKLEGVVETHENYLSDKFAIPANLVGIPSMSIPCNPTEKGFSIGMQIMANKYCENIIYQVANALEGNNV